ncbi:MAG: 16S rRNA (guanine(527)-N(7))-methyltransferase RsmG [Desulfofustis sp. PB-SRB1]|jgi:16S rRNA (guanine527-N7)-methyltransferase|nr:16S rRNA (guanine(527)-N(7))-methyltransferase RsmG [Desulfofustis sp. PB-SRB1]
MDNARFAAMVGEGAESLGVAMSPAGLDTLYRYFKELAHWNRKVNLISRNLSAQEIVEKHFIDCLAPLRLLGASDRLLDVGTGAGFPGLVCKIGAPAMTVHLIEPRLKRVSFLRQVIRLLGLDDVFVHNGRLGDGSVVENSAGTTCVISRAVMEIGEFLTCCERFTASSCRVIFMKGPAYEDELPIKVRRLHGFALKYIDEYRLPFSGSRRTLLVFQGEADA